MLFAPLTDQDTTFNASVFDINLFLNPASTITALHALTRNVICHFSVGTLKASDPDAASFLPSDLGAGIEGVETWLDTNSVNVRAVMTTRIELAASLGCDGIDPDDVDAYNNVNGFNLTTADAVDYLTFLADATHSRGLSIGLKNAGEIVTDVLPLVEWAMTEGCIQTNDCATFTPFIDAGKPVFHIEYPPGAGEFVSAALVAMDCGAPAGFSSILKATELNDWIQVC